jgi:hypothetical protein
MEMGFSRDGLDHILNAVKTQTSVLAGQQLPKLRTTSHMAHVARPAGFTRTGKCRSSGDT